MDVRELQNQMCDLISRGGFREAEDRLLNARSVAEEEDDAVASETILGLLVQLYCASEPPDVAKADALCVERERLRPNAYSKLQTAMVMYHCGHDYVRADRKLREAIAVARAAGDDTQAYSALALLGQTMLALRRFDEVEEVLHDIERMVLEGQRFVAGDETPFLEAVCVAGVHVSSARRIAAAVMPLCRDADFARRLAAVSSGNRT